jgi:hypothetical protein
MYTKMTRTSAKVVFGLSLVCFTLNHGAMAQLSGQSFKDKSIKRIDVGVETPSEKAAAKDLEPFESLANDTVQQLKAGDKKSVIDNSQPDKTAATANFDDVLQKDAIPYFSDFAKPAENLTVVFAENAGDKGFAFYDSFVSSSGKIKPFCLTILKHDGRMYVASIGTNRTFKDQYPKGNEDIVVFRKQNAIDFLNQKQYGKDNLATDKNDEAMVQEVFAQKVKTGGTSTVSPVGVYKDYAFDKNADSFDPQNKVNVENVENGDGELIQVMKKGDGFVTLKMISGCQFLNVPFGWYGIETGRETVLFSPDKVDRIIFRVVPKAAAAQAAKIIEQIKSKQPAILESTKHFPDGSSILQMTNVKTPSGKTNANFQVYSPMPNHPDYLASLNLTCRQEEFDKYKGLVGLMIRDRKIDQKMFEVNNLSQTH